MTPITVKIKHRHSYEPSLSLITEPVLEQVLKGQILILPVYMEALQRIESSSIRAAGTGTTWMTLSCVSYMSTLLAVVDWRHHHVNTARRCGHFYNYSPSTRNYNERTGLYLTNCWFFWPQFILSCFIFIFCLVSFCWFVYKYSARRSLSKTTRRSVGSSRRVYLWLF